MPFLVIGGHAVNSYGIARHTGDLNLLVRGTQKSAWSTLFVDKLRYSPIQDDDRFTRYKPAELAAWPIDLMYVDDSTFSKMHATSRKFDFGQVDVQVVSARHLVILKIHALKYFQAHRYSKDYTDVVGLLRSGQAVFSKEEIREICLKHATEDIFEKLERDLVL